MRIQNNLFKPISYNTKSGNPQKLKKEVLQPDAKVDKFVSAEKLQQEMYKKMYPVKPGEGNPEYAHPCNGPIKNNEDRVKMNQILEKLQKGQPLTSDEKAFLASIGAQDLIQEAEQIEKESMKQA